MKHFYIPLLVSFFIVYLPGCSPDIPQQKLPDQHYIAHAGGSIQGYRYTNSLEAIQCAMSHGVTFIELDLCITSDGQLVAWHDWTFKWDGAPTYAAFMARKIDGLFTPLDYRRIDSIMVHNPELSLVTDKISDPILIDSLFHAYKDRVWVECFTDDDYWALQELGYHVYASKEPPVKSKQPDAIRNYVFHRFLCPDLSKKDGDAFSLFSFAELTKSMADSMFATDPRIKFVYIDYYE